MLTQYAYYMKFLIFVNKTNLKNNQKTTNKTKERLENDIADVCHALLVLKHRCLVYAGRSVRKSGFQQNRFVE